MYGSLVCRPPCFAVFEDLTWILPEVTERERERERFLGTYSLVSPKFQCILVNKGKTWH